MAERPMGNAVAPPRRTRQDAGETDALSVVLGIDEDESTATRRIEAQILGLLRETGKPVSVDEIARELHVDFLSLSKRLLYLTRRGAIRLKGSPGNELATLASDAR
jgi:predicted transcriptional regulator